MHTSFRFKNKYLIINRGSKSTLDFLQTTNYKQMKVQVNCEKNMVFLERQVYFGMHTSKLYITNFQSQLLSLAKTLIFVQAGNSNYTKVFLYNLQAIGNWFVRHFPLFVSLLGKGVKTNSIPRV